MIITFYANGLNMANVINKLDYAFENPSGRDTVVDGYLSPGGDIDKVYGIPYPFFQNTDAPDSPASTRTGEKQVIPTAASPDAYRPSQK